jgi:hypothetical protein
MTKSYGTCAVSCYRYNHLHPEQLPKTKSDPFRKHLVPLKVPQSDIRHALTPFDENQLFRPFAFKNDHPWTTRDELHIVILPG